MEEPVDIKGFKESIRILQRRKGWATVIIEMGVAMMILGFSLLYAFNTYMPLSWIVGFGTLLFIVGIGLWLVFEVQRSNLIKKLKTYLAADALKQRKEWELIREVLSD